MIIIVSVLCTPGSDRSRIAQVIQPEIVRVKEVDSSFVKAKDSISHVADRRADSIALLRAQLRVTEAKLRETNATALAAVKEVREMITEEEYPTTEINNLLDQVDILTVLNEEHISTADSMISAQQRQIESQDSLILAAEFTIEQYRQSVRNIIATVEWREQGYIQANRRLRRENKTLKWVGVALIGVLGATNLK